MTYFDGIRWKKEPDLDSFFEKRIFSIAFDIVYLSVWFAEGLDFILTFSIQLEKNPPFCVKCGILFGENSPGPSG